MVGLNKPITGLLVISLALFAIAAPVPSRQAAVLSSMIFTGKSSGVSPRLSGIKYSRRDSTPKPSANCTEGSSYNATLEGTLHLNSMSGDPDQWVENKQGRQWVRKDGLWTSPDGKPLENALQSADVSLDDYSPKYFRISICQSIKSPPKMRSMRATMLRRDDSDSSLGDSSDAMSEDSQPEADEPAGDDADASFSMPEMPLVAPLPPLSPLPALPHLPALPPMSQMDLFGDSSPDAEDKDMDASFGDLFNEDVLDSEHSPPEGLEGSLEDLPTDDVPDPDDSSLDLPEDSPEDAALDGSDEPPADAPEAPAQPDADKPPADANPPPPTMPPAMPPANSTQLPSDGKPSADNPPSPPPQGEKKRRSLFRREMY